MKEEIPKNSYLTHNIHKYTAKLIPHIPRYLITKHAPEGSLVLDPFCGSGTTILEARLLGHCAIGIDINPLAVLISKVKTTPLDEIDLELAVKTINKKLVNYQKQQEISFPNIKYWFANGL